MLQQHAPPPDVDRPHGESHPRALWAEYRISKANYFIQIIGMDSGTSLLILMGGIVAGTIANGVGIWELSRVGRRKVIIVSLGAATVLWVRDIDVRRAFGRAWRSRISWPPP